MGSLQTALGFGGILSGESIDYIVEHFKKMNLKANDEFLSLGAVANEMGFINNGIMRCYALSNQGEEVTKYFVRENQFIVDLESYYNSTPSETALQAVVDSELLIIKRGIWNKLYEEVPQLFILTKSMTEAALMNKMKDNDFLNFGTAVDKYREFLHRYPDLALRVPQHFIASYLKITPQSLSRIRKSFCQQKQS